MKHHVSIILSKISAKGWRVGYELNVTEALDFRKYTPVMPSGAKELKVDASLYISDGMIPVINPSTGTRMKDRRMIFSLLNLAEKEYVIRYNTVAP